MSVPEQATSQPEPAPQSMEQDAGPAEPTETAVTASATQDADEIDDLDDMEFMLDEIENRIAPLA